MSHHVYDERSIGAPMCPVIQGRPTLLQRAIDSFPALLVAVWALSFAVGGTSLPLPREGVWQWVAGVMALTNLVAAALPYTPNTRIVAGTVSILFTGAFSIYLSHEFVIQSDVGQRLSVFGVTQYFMITVFMAWTYGRRASHHP